jgi:hypothetical protein
MKIDNSNYIGALIYREDFRNFKEFAFSAIASNLIRRGLRKENRAGLKSGRAWKSRHPSNPSYFQLSNIIFSKVLSISKSTVTRLKKSASETGYLNIKKVIYPIRPHPKIKIGLNEINFLRQYGDYDPNTLRITNHFQIAVQEPDLIASNVITRVVKPLKGLVHKS